MAGLGSNIWVIANWKSNKTIAEALEWVSYVGPRIERQENLKVAVCSSFVDVEEVKKAVKVGNYPMLVGVQDLSPYDTGAYTGEEAARILKDFVDLAILGHSERRVNFGETDEMVAKKVAQAKEHDIIPLICVQSPDTPIPEGVELVAYEPIFAIGTGKPDTPENANALAAQLIRKQRPPAGGLEVLYGGSVTSENVKEFISEDNLSGVLVGQASLEMQEFIKIIEVAM